VLPPHGHCICTLRNATAIKFMKIFVVAGQSMDNVKHIEEAIEALPPAELAEFRRWFASFDYAAWDRQIDADMAAGMLNALATEALEDYKLGSSRPI
jgi:hypothetical protein